MRTIPNDHHQTGAMVSLLRAYSWTWVGIIITDGDYGRSALDHFLTHASEKGLCVAFKHILPDSVTYQDVSSAITVAAKTILNNPKVQVIVSFTRSTHMTYLYQELHNQTAGHKSARRVWVASDAWSTSSSAIGHLSLDDIGHIVGFTFKRGDLTSFNEYLSRLEAAEQDYTATNAFLKEFYEHLNDTEGSTDIKQGSTAVDILRKYMNPGTVFSTEMAVSAIARAVASICRSRDCKTPGSVQPWQVFSCVIVFCFSRCERESGPLYILKKQKSDF